MDLVSTVRKSGSRGGVNFSWDDVATSSHRENYLGHSLKAPVGRWQQGKDLQWYAKADADTLDPNETEEERKARQRKEEIQMIKEAEEDAMAKALGLPPPVRNKTGANAIQVAGSRPASDEPERGGLQITKKEGTEQPHQLRRSDGRHGRQRDEQDRDHHRRHRHRSRSHNRDRRRERGPRDKGRELGGEDEPRARREHARPRRHGESTRQGRSRTRSPDGAKRKRSRSRERHGGHERHRRRSPGQRRSFSPRDRRRGGDAGS